MICPKYKNLATLIFSMIITLSFICLFIACEDRATNEDHRRVEIIKKKYGEHLDIILEKEINIKLKDRSSLDGGITEEMATDIYKMFFFMTPNREAQRVTVYTYLNVYDANNKFEYLIYYDPKSKKIVKSVTEYY